MPNNMPLTGPRWNTVLLTRIVVVRPEVVPIGWFEQERSLLVLCESNLLIHYSL